MANRRRNVFIRYSLFLALVTMLYIVYGGGEDTASPHRVLCEKNHTSGSSLYPADLLLTQPYYDSANKGLLIFHFLGVLYMFSGLAIVCDDYFVAALDEMVENWNLTPDVAGATLMAAGGSAPELFTSLMGVTVSESDVGFGTIVGSAVFNVLFVIGLCAIFAKQTLKLTWWPLFRDCTFYSLSLMLLAFLVSTTSTPEGAASAGEIEFWEAAVLFGCYLLYVFIMSRNEQLKAFAEGFVARKQAVVPVGDSTSSEPKSIFTPRRHSALHLMRDIRGEAIRSILNGDVDRMVRQKIEEGEYKLDFSACRTASKKLHVAASYIAHQARTQSRALAEAEANAKTVSSECESETIEEDEGGNNPLEWPQSRISQVFFLINLPLQLLLVCTIPNCSNTKWKKWYVATFGISLVWIAIFSFMMVWWAETIGDALGIPPNIMGLTFLAAGTSIPDALSSVIVARQGFGDMAVSSSIGSNIFDILFGLPVPWMIKTGIIGKFKHVVVIQSPYLITNVLTLLAMVAFVILSIMYFKWKLSRGLGAVMFVLYVLFLALSLSLEYCDSLGLC